MATTQQTYDKIYQKTVDNGNCTVKCSPESMIKLRAGLNRARQNYEKRISMLGDTSGAPKFSMEWNDEESAVIISIKEETEEFEIL